MAHPPDDFSTMFQEEIDRHADPRGILPIPLANARYAQLDRLVTEKLAEQGITRSTIAEYRAALREVIDELLADKRELNPGLPITGADVADRAETLLTARGVSMKAATSDEYAEALASAKEVLDREGRSDILAAVRKRLIADYEPTAGDLTRLLSKRSTGKISTGKA
jgi:hypothetical protein